MADIDVDLYAVQGALDEIQRLLRQLEAFAGEIDELAGGVAVNMASDEAEVRRFDRTTLNLSLPDAVLSKASDRLEALADKYEEMLKRVLQTSLIHIEYEKPKRRRPTNPPVTLYFTGVKTDPATQNKYPLFDVLTFSWDGSDLTSFEIEDQRYFFLDSVLPRLAIGEDFLADEFAHFSDTSHRTIWFHVETQGTFDQAKVYRYRLDEAIPESDAPSFDPDPIDFTRTIDVVELNPEAVLYNTNVAINPATLEYEELNAGDLRNDYKTGPAGELWRRYDQVTLALDYRVTGVKSIGLIDTSVVSSTVQGTSIDYLWTSPGGSPTFDGVYQSTWIGPDVYFDYTFTIEEIGALSTYTQQLDVQMGPGTNFDYHWSDSDGNDYRFDGTQTTQSGPASGTWMDYVARPGPIVGPGAANVGFPGTFTIRGPGIDGLPPQGQVLYAPLLEMYQRSMPLDVGTCQDGKFNGFGYQAGTNYGTYTDPDLPPLGFQVYPPQFAQFVQWGGNVTHKSLGTNTQCIDGTYVVNKTFGNSPPPPPPIPDTRVLLRTYPLGMYSIFDTETNLTDLCMGVNGEPIVEGGGDVSPIYGMASDGDELIIFVEDANNGDIVKAIRIVSGAADVLPVIDQDGNPIVKLWDDDGRPGKLGALLLNNGVGLHLYYGLTIYNDPNLPSPPPGSFPVLLGLGVGRVEGGQVVLDISRENFVALPYSIGGNIVSGHVTTDIVDF